MIDTKIREFILLKKQPMTEDLEKIYNAYLAFVRTTRWEPVGFHQVQNNCKQFIKRRTPKDKKIIKKERKEKKNKDAVAAYRKRTR